MSRRHREVGLIELYWHGALEDYRHIQVPIVVILLGMALICFLVISG